MPAAEILIVDDESNLAEALLFVLESEGYPARHVPNGEAALKALLESAAPLVISDYMMPVMDGAQLLQAIRSRPELEKTPVLVVSSLPEDVVRTHCATAQGFLRKPFQASVLVERVRQILGPPGALRD